RTREHRRHREEERALARSHLGHHHVGRLAAAAETALPPHLDVRVEAGPPDLLHERGVEPRRLAHLAALRAATHDDPVALHSPMALGAKAATAFTVRGSSATHATASRPAPPPSASTASITSPRICGSFSNVGSQR